MGIPGDKKLTVQSIFILALLCLSACSTGPEADQENMVVDPDAPAASAAATDPAAAVAGATADVAKSPTDVVPDDHNPEIELAIAAGAVIVDPQNPAAAGQMADAGAGAAAPAGGGLGLPPGPGDAASVPPMPGASNAAAMPPMPPADGAAVSALPVPPMGGDAGAMPMPPPPVAAAEEPVVKGKKHGKKFKHASGAGVASVGETKALAPGEGVSYTVKEGDTLMKIAFEQYGDLYRWREIYNLNKGQIADPNHVPPGTTIQIAGSGRNPASAKDHQGEQYMIKNGDTLGKISKQVYGTLEKWKKLWDNNKQLIRDPNKIYAGFYLYYLPEGKVSSTQETELPSTTAGV